MMEGRQLSRNYTDLARHCSRRPSSSGEPWVMYGVTGPNGLKQHTLQFGR